MKFWKRALAFTLALGLSFSFAACEEEESSGVGSVADSSSLSEIGNSSDDSSSVIPSPPPAAATEEDIFTAVKAAYNATCAYAGGFKTSYTERECGYTWWRNESFDPQTGNSYRVRSDGEYTDTEKTFTTDTVAYSLERYEEDSETEEYYTKLSPASVEEIRAERASEDIDEFVGNIFLADTAAELRSSYQTVIASSIAKENAAGNAATGESTVSCAKEGDVYELTIAFDLSLTAEIEYDPDTIFICYELNVQAENGKISRIDYYMEFVYDKEVSPEDTEEDELRISTEYDYAFDQSGFDAIGSELPDPEEIEDESEVAEPSLMDHFIDFYVNGIEVTDWMYYMESDAPMQRAASVADAYEKTLAYAPKTLDGDSSDRAKLGEIDGWYTDEKCTEKFDAANATLDDWFALEGLYAKTTVDDGYVIVSVEETEEWRLSKAYRIVLEGRLYKNGIFSTPDYIRALSEFENNEYTFREGETVLVETYVNGKKQADNLESLALTGGTTYLITRVTVYGDEDCSIFESLM